MLFHRTGQLFTLDAFPCSSIQPLLPISLRCPEARMVQSLCRENMSTTAKSRVMEIGCGCEHAACR